MIDSPYHPYSDAKFTLNEKGTDDLEDESMKKRSKKSEE
jgi:DNA repair protein RadA